MRVSSKRAARLSRGFSLSLSRRIRESEESPSLSPAPSLRYCISNLRFAAAFEPANADVAAALARAEARRAVGEPTVPSTLGDELALNPFLRVCSPCVARAAGVAPRGDDARGESGGERDAAKALYEREVAAVAVTAALRRRKDTFTTVGKVITLALDVQSAFTAPPSDDDDDGGGGGGDSDSDDPIEQEGDTPPLGALGCLGGAPQRI